MELSPHLTSAVTLDLINIGFREAGWSSVGSIPTPFCSQERMQPGRTKPRPVKAPPPPGRSPAQRPSHPCACANAAGVAVMTASRLAGLLGRSPATAWRAAASKRSRGGAKVAGWVAKAQGPREASCPAEAVCERALGVALVSSSAPGALVFTATALAEGRKHCAIWRAHCTEPLDRGGKVSLLGIRRPFTFKFVSKRI